MKIHKKVFTTILLILLAVVVIGGGVSIYIQNKTKFSEQNSYDMENKETNKIELSKINQSQNTDFTYRIGSSYYEAKILLN